MELSDILKPEAVKSVGKSVSKKRVLQEMAELAANLHDFSPEIAFQALLDRENLGPTGVGDGVAIPHARIEGLEKVVGVFYRLEKPVEYDSVDRQPVDLLFALFAPTDSGVDHLKALAQVSRLLRDSAIRAKLRANDNAATLYTIISEVTTHKAA
ncbi:MAG: PTS sugar transporter subunit IIA [Rhodobacteraceae bacterium]|nr:PTS sugar transporter subunit IIA [Paracoccaceae bacterium]